MEVVGKENRLGRAAMSQNEKMHIALHAPNIINICIDNYDNGEMSGRIYHCYEKNPWHFSNIIKLVEAMEDLFDGIAFPQASTQVRMFMKTEHRKKIGLNKVKDVQEVINHRGELGTFLTHVKYRQNSSWQGEIEWVEGEEKLNFISVLELLKILNNLLEKEK